MKQLESGKVIEAEWCSESDPKQVPDLEIIPLEVTIMDTLCMKSYDNLHKEI